MYDLEHPMGVTAVKDVFDLPTVEVGVVAKIASVNHDIVAAGLAGRVIAVDVNASVSISILVSIETVALTGDNCAASAVWRICHRRRDQSCCCQKNENENECKAFHALCLSLMCMCETNPNLIEIFVIIAYFKVSYNMPKTFSTSL